MYVVSLNSCCRGQFSTNASMSLVYISDLKMNIFFINWSNFDLEIEIFISINYYRYIERSVRLEIIVEK